MSKYRTSWSQIQEQMNEFALSHTVRYRDPLNKKRFAVPFKTAEKAKAKMDQLKRDGVKEIEITKDVLRGKFKEDLDLQETNPMGYTVKFANRKGARIATAWYKDEADAKKALEMIKKNGGNGIISKGRWDEETIAEDGHTDVPSSKRMAQVIAEEAQLILKELEKKSEEESLPTWWTNKLATSAHNMNAARDYITNDIKEDIKEARWEIEGRVSYKGVSAEDSFHMVIDAPTESAAEDKAYDELEKARKQRKIGPGGGGSIDDMEIESIEKTNDRLQAPTADFMGNSYDPSKKEVKEAMSDAQLKKVRDSYKDLKTISPEKVKTLKNFLDRYSTDSLMQLAQANINFVSTMARSVMNKRKMGDPKHAGSMRENAAQDMEKVAKLRIQQMKIQTKVQKMDRADPKNRTPLAIAKNDLDNLQMRMDQLKDRAQKTKNEEVHPAKALIEAIEAVKNKAEKTGMSYSILKQVYDRGMAAWKGGHRSGTTPQQWALARVNSFVTKSSGTWGGADSDLAKKVRSKK